MLGGDLKVTVGVRTFLAAKLKLGKLTYYGLHNHNILSYCLKYQAYGSSAVLVIVILLFCKKFDFFISASACLIFSDTSPYSICHSVVFAQTLIHTYTEETFNKPLHALHAVCSVIHDFLKSQQLLYVPSSLTYTNFRFYIRIVFMCLVWISA